MWGPAEEGGLPVAAKKDDIRAESEKLDDAGRGGASDMGAAAKNGSGGLRETGRWSHLVVFHGNNEQPVVKHNSPSNRCATVTCLYICAKTFYLYFCSAGLGFKTLASVARPVVFKKGRKNKMFSVTIHTLLLVFLKFERQDLTS